MHKIISLINYTKALGFTIIGFLFGMALEFLMEQVSPFIFSSMIAAGVILIAIYVFVEPLNRLLISRNVSGRYALIPIPLSAIIIFFGWPIVYDFQWNRVPRNLSFEVAGPCRSSSKGVPQVRGFNMRQQTFTCRITNASNISATNISLEVINTLSSGSCTEGFVFPPLVRKVDIGVGSLQPGSSFHFETLTWIMQLSSTKGVEPRIVSAGVPYRSDFMENLDHVHPVCGIIEARLVSAEGIVGSWDIYILRENRGGELTVSFGKPPNWSMPQVFQSLKNSDQLIEKLVEEMRK